MNAKIKYIKEQNEEVIATAEKKSKKANEVSEEIVRNLTTEEVKKLHEINACVYDFDLEKLIKNLN
ncbi:MAG: hypothetical protein QW714_02150 [Nanopusillaceae archaeon]